METTKKREDYIDMMKALGMLFIIWGHCFPPVTNSFIYAFNVPLFFIISGFLTRSDDTWSVVWRKCWINLLLPYFILSFLHCAGFIFKHINDGQWIYSVVGIFGGFHSLHEAAACSNMWFVYTLVVIRLLFCLAARKKYGIAILFVTSIIAAVVYHLAGLQLLWAVTDAFVALPFFLFGHLLSRSWRDGYEHFVLFLKNLRCGQRGALCLSLFLLTGGVAAFNGTVGMFKGSYGHSLLLCLVGGAIGSAAVLTLSLCLNNNKIIWGG